MPDRVRRWLIFILACQLFVLSQFYRASVAVISPDLIQELAIDTRQLSLISAAFFYAFALMQIPITMYLDGIGPRISMTVLSLIAVIGAIVFSFGHSVPALVTGRVLMGIGMACNLMGPLKIITLWFTPRHFATLSAFVVSIGTVGNLIAATPLVLMAQSMGWRNSFLVIGAINLCLVFLFYLITRDRPRESIVPDVPRAASTQLREIGHSLRHLIKEKDYWIISLGTFCRYGIYAAVQSLWAGPFLIHTIGLSAVSAGNLLILMSIGIVIGSPISGWLSDTGLRNRKGVITTGLMAMGIILIGLTQLPSGAGMTVWGILFFFFGFSSSTGGIMYAHIKERMPPESAGAAMTGINFFTMIGSAVFLQGLGSMMQYLYPGDSLGNAAFIVAFLFCAVCLGITAIFYLFTVETLGKRK
ncbi:MAG TPA: MFS transporter [Syntrophales bacterium]|nr:MFS transporter [Syntrophales bacterium]HPQ43131.1 MFS transporter [Syntrophales bacterium]